MMTMPISSESEDIVDGNAAKNASESEAMQCSESSGTSAMFSQHLSQTVTILRMKGNHTTCTFMRWISSCTVLNVL